MRFPPRLRALRTSADPLAHTSDAPPLRAQPRAADGGDDARVRLVRDRWHGQDAALLERDRLVEECVRMLCGRQWDVWAPALGQFVDVTRFMSDAEKRWRQRPVLNLLEHWFMLTHARLTENPPVVGWQPASADRKDAMLAEVLDTVYKTCWRDCAMDERMVRLIAWVVAAGEGYLKTRPDYTAGPERELRGAAMLQGGDGEEAYAEDVPFDRHGVALARLLPRFQPTPQRDAAFEAGAETAEGDPRVDPDSPEFDSQLFDELWEQPTEEVIPSPGAGDPGAEVEDAEWEWEPTGEAHRQRDGELRTDVLGPLEVRAEWGHGIAWDQRRWVIHRTYLALGEARRLYPEANLAADRDAGAMGAGLGGGASLSGGYLERMMFGAGYFGQAAGQGPGGGVGTSGTAGTDADGFVCIDELWEKPSDGFPKGRCLVTATYQGKVCSDGPRPAPFKCAGPIRHAPFVQLPGRPGGSTPLEMMIPIQKAYNRGWAQILEHRARCTTPIMLVHEGAGIDVRQITNAPGSIVTHASQLPNPITYLVPPPLPADVWKVQDQLLNHAYTIGSVHGAEGKAPTEGASGELVSQLRFNADRFISPAAKSAATAVAGWADDARAWLQILWTDARVLTTAGEDGVLRTITVAPELWEGTANAVPDLESMLPESRGERQVRARQDWKEGVFGDPLSDRARRAYMDVARYPHANRALRPGGAHASTAQQNLGLLAQGAAIDDVPVFPWYDFEVFVPTTEDYMASPEYKDLAPDRQAAFVQYRKRLLLAGVAKQAEMAQLEGLVAQAQARVQLQTQAAVMPQQQALAAAQGRAEGQAQGTSEAAAFAANPKAQADAQFERQQAAQQAAAKATGPKSRSSSSR